MLILNHDVMCEVETIIIIDVTPKRQSSSCNDEATKINSQFQRNHNNMRVDACARVFYWETFTFIKSYLNKTKCLFTKISASIHFKI